MKVTKLGAPQPILNAGPGFNAGTRIPPGGDDLTVLTSNGSNGRYWGENVARITVNGSTAAVGPYVDFANGSNTTVSVASNTIRIHATGGGASLTVEDEGTPLATDATTLDFVGAGVTASGAGATKTITIPGGSGITVEDEGSPLTTSADTLDFVGAGVTASGAGTTKTITIPGGGSGGGGFYLDGLTLDATHGDEFDGTSLDAMWTPTGTFDVDVTQFAVGDTWMRFFARSASAQSIYQTGPTKETLEVIGAYSLHGVTANMFGVSIVSSTGTGVLAALRFDTSQLVLNNVASYAYTSDGVSVAIGGGNAVMEYMRGQKVWMSLRKVPTQLVGDVYFARFSKDGFTWGKNVHYVPATFTYAKLGIGQLFGGGAADDVFAIDRFNVIDALDIGNNLVITPTSGTSTQTASSQFSGSFSPDKAADNNNATGWSPSNGATDFAGAGLFWTNTWSVGQSLNRVVFKERSGDTFGFAHLELFDGAVTTKVPVGDFVLGTQQWHVVDFPTLTGITTLTIVCDSTPGANPGFTEVEAYLRS